MPGEDGGIWIWTQIVDPADAYEDVLLRRPSGTPYANLTAPSHRDREYRCSGARACAT